MRCEYTAVPQLYPPPKHHLPGPHGSPYNHAGGSREGLAPGWTPTPHSLRESGVPLTLRKAQAARPPPQKADRTAVGGWSESDKRCNKCGKIRGVR